MFERMYVFPSPALTPFVGLQKPTSTKTNRRNGGLGN